MWKITIHFRELCQSRGAIRKLDWLLGMGCILIDVPVLDALLQNRLDLLNFFVKIGRIHEKTFLAWSPECMHNVFQHVALSGHVGILRWMFKNGLGLRRVYPRGTVPMPYLMMKTEKVFEELISQGLCAEDFARVGLLSETLFRAVVSPAFLPLLKSLNFDPEVVRGSCRPALKHVSLHPRLETLRLLVEMGVTADDCRAADVVPRLALYNDEGLLDWLSEMGITLDDCQPSSFILQYAAARGNINTLRWLQRLGADLAYCRSVQNLALQAAVRHGKMDSLSWLEMMGIRLEDLQANDHEVFITAMEKPNKEVLAWLEHMGVTADDCRARDNFAVCMAAQTNNIELLEWLLARGLGVEDFRARREEPMRLAAAHDHQGVLDWLRKINAHK